MCLGAADEGNLARTKVEAIAKSANLNIRSELPHYLRLLERRRLIDTSKSEVQVLGIKTRGVLGHAANIFDDASPTPREVAAIKIGELVSQSPVLFVLRSPNIKSLLGDRCQGT